MTKIIKNGIQYNIDPSAVNAKELLVTTPEVEVIASKQPFYQKQLQYALAHTYGPTQEERIQENKRNANIASNYFNSNPSIGNLAKGAWYWLKSKPYFLGQSEDKNTYITGIAPLPSGTSARIQQYTNASKITPPMSGEAGVRWLRKAFDSDELFLGGKQLESTINAPYIQGHGIAKASTPQSALGQLRALLDNGIDPSRTFYTGPLATSQAGSAIGTGSGMPYTNGLFIVAGKPNQFINKSDDIKTILINDGFESPETKLLAQRLQQYLKKAYPNTDAVLFSEAPAYYAK